MDSYSLAIMSFAWGMSNDSFYEILNRKWFKDWVWCTRIRITSFHLENVTVESNAGNLSYVSNERNWSSQMSPMNEICQMCQMNELPITQPKLRGRRFWSPWLDKSNSSVVMFSVIFIRLFRQWHWEHTSVTILHSDWIHSEPTSLLKICPYYSLVVFKNAFASSSWMTRK